MRIPSLGERIIGLFVRPCGNDDDAMEDDGGNPWLVLLFKWDSVFDEYRNPGTREWWDWSEGAIDENWRQECLFFFVCVSVIKCLCQLWTEVENRMLLFEWKKRWATKWEGLWLGRERKRWWKWRRKHECVCECDHALNFRNLLLTKRAFPLAFDYVTPFIFQVHARPSLK